VQPRHRDILAAALAAVAAAVFINLGLWQLRRLDARRQRNAQLSSRFAANPVPLATLSADSTAVHYRRVSVTGTFDFDHQLVFGARSHQGSPGVYILTPLVPDDSGTAVLVNRGWVYSPNAERVNLSRWDEPPHVTIDGYVEEFTTGDGPPIRGSDPNVWFRLDGPAIAASLPYPVLPFYVVAVAPGPATAPVRLELPALDEGPHRGYAIQWFTFAIIAVVGVSTLIWQGRQRSTRPA